MLCLCVTALPGVICGIVGLSAIGKSNGQLKGRGLAIVGIVLSLILTIVGAAGWTAFGGKHLANNPMWRELFGAGKAMMVGATNGQLIMTALRAHADATEGRLPGSLDELVAAGGLEASTLNHPTEGSPGFWTLTQPGAVLADLPPRTVIVRGGPITIQGESMEVVIFANGDVQPREVSGGALMEGEDVGGGVPDEGVAVPEPAESAPER